MEPARPGFPSIDAYIHSFPADKQALLQAVRAAVKAAAPDAQERISYAMPTFWLDGNLVHFAALKNHIGFYPTSSGIEAFRDELSRYEGTKGAIRFPIDEPLPLELIGRIVRFRVAENRQRAAEKAARKPRGTRPAPVPQIRRGEG